MKVYDAVAIVTVNSHDYRRNCRFTSKVACGKQKKQC